MLEQEQHPMNTVQQSVLPAPTSGNTEPMVLEPSNPRPDPLASLEHMISNRFSDLSYSTTISGNGYPMLTIWQHPSKQLSKGIAMKDLPLFYIVATVNDSINLCLRLITFHGKVVSELNENVNDPQQDTTRTSFIQKLNSVQLCQGVKVLDPTLKLDPQTFTFLYLVELLEQSVIVRSRQCQFGLEDGKLVCEVCEALNESATNKKPIVQSDGGLFPISGIGAANDGSGDTSSDVKPLLLPEVHFNDNIDDETLKEEGLIDDDYWSQNGDEIDEEDPDWASDTKPTARKTKKLRKTRSAKKERTPSSLKKKELKCTQCDHEPFKTRTELKEHLMEDHEGAGIEKLMYNCTEIDCTFEGVTQKSLSEHKEEVHGISQTFKCRYCPDFETDTRKRLSKHMATEHAPKDGSSKPYGCKRCPSTWFRLKSELRRHVAVAHYDGPFKCDQCSFEATKKWRLHEHVRFVHEKIKPFLCDQCSQPFARRERLVRHIKAVHDKIRDFKCPHEGCTYEAARSSQLKIHITSVHEKLKPFLCEHCSYEGPTKSDITRHVKHVHATVKPFKCQHCPYETTANPGLLKHIQTVHAGIKPYKCPHCTYECAMKQQLTLHIRAIHEKVRPYTCDLCSFAAARKQEVVRHRTAVHDPSKHFVCHYCPYKSPRRHIVTQHIRKTHDRNYMPPNKKIGRRLAPDPRSQPGLVAALQNPSDKDRNTLYNISVEQKKEETNVLMNTTATHHLQNQGQPSTIPLVQPTVEYHSIKVEHLPNY